MKIEDDTKLKECLFEEVNCGEVFVHMNQVYLKANGCVDGSGNITQSVGSWEKVQKFAVSLESGDAVQFERTDKVVRRAAVLHLK